MVEITVTDESAVFEVKGLHKLWAFRSRIEVPREHILGARVDPEVARGWWHGFRAPGTQLPGLTAGTFYEHGKKVFWDVNDPEKTIVVELADERYNELIVEVADPEAAVALLTGKSPG